MDGVSQWLPKPEWEYLLVEIRVEDSDEPVPVTFDYLVFQSMILSGLRKYNGIIGESVPYDILHVAGRRCLLRVAGQYGHYFDHMRFYTCNLSKYNSDASQMCTFLVTKSRDMGLFLPLFTAVSS